MALNINSANFSNRYDTMYNNQFFDYLSQQLPTNHAEMFRWCEIMYASTPVLVNGIKKITNYPLTDLIYKSDSDDQKERTKKFLEETLDIKSLLITLGVDYYVYGNVFRSVHFDFTRFLRCGHKNCGSEININNLTYTYRKEKFRYTCSTCKRKTVGTIVDTDTSALEGVNIISWNPKQISLIQNPITRKTTYYYKVPGAVQKGVRLSEKTMINSLPEIFLDAIAKKRSVEFNSNLYVFQAPTLTGHNSGWSLSPILPALKLFLYNSILRKSVEAISLEHIVPKRVLYPQSTTSDPTMTTNLAKWKEELTDSLAKWRQDPNHTVLAPVPTGVVNLGSQGRALMPTQEIRQAEEDMLRAIEIPVELVYNTANINNSPITLRVLENQLTPYMGQVVRFVNWIIRLTNSKLKQDLCEIEFSPFKLADDVQKQQLMTQLLGSAVSKTTLQETLSLDPKEEADKLFKERVTELEQSKDLELEQSKVNADITTQTLEEEAATTGGAISDLQNRRIYGEAEMLSQQLASAPYEQRRSQLAALQKENVVMYAMVRMFLDSTSKARREQGAAQPGQDTVQPMNQPTIGGTPNE